MKVNLRLQTGGDGFWSGVEREVLCTRLALTTHVDSYGSGGLNVYFDTDTWDVIQHGIIYTDSFWLIEFKRAMLKLGFTRECLVDVDYSEQGQQGEDFVNLDVPNKFILQYREITRKPE